MKIGSHCFKDSQLSSMIDSHKKYGDCDITGKKNCLIYDTYTDIYLEESLEGLFDIFTIDKKKL